MLSNKVRILNFDDSITLQKRLMEKFQPEVVDFKKLGPYCRLWSNEKEAGQIRMSLNPESKNRITFLGSGDYHHISGLLTEQFREPISLIVFDHHPDWDILPPGLGCGSWVTYSLRKQNVMKAVILGVSSEDISSVWVQTGNLNSLKDDRVEIYPYAHKPTVTLLKKVPQNISMKIKRGFGYNKISWQELRGKNQVDFLSGLISSRIKTKQVYVSIDKDCLKSDYSLTNWEEGFFDLEELLGLLKVIKNNLDIVGLDIVGDYSAPRVEGRFKSFLSRIDHPKIYSAKNKTDVSISALNEQTNLKILELLLQ
ncbi:MAG: hypothetical protein PHN57_04465 [Candidatus Omnitrophica bacterium]|nr:hypothetical protein [Candidatus Omnitrophota bacterium]